MADATLQLDSLLPAEGHRYRLVEGFPLHLTSELVQAIKKKTPRAQWLFEEELATPELRLRFNKDELPLAIIDATHQTAPRSIEKSLKHFLQNFPRSQALVIGEDALRSVQIPNFYGDGLYTDCATMFTSAQHLSHGQPDAALLKLSRKILPKYSMDDLVLGPMTDLKFSEAIDYIRTKEFCEQDWGFKARHNRGHGVTLLFHGESGTGKTMGAEVLAHELKLPLYQIDLSAIMSKYVGETEKNLKSVFRSAEGVKGILLFDEGDAIFGSRSDTKSSQDRYANLEVNYLLQEIEAFDGIAVLSTNYFSNMDAAFLRRFSYVIQFGIPVEEQRLRIWGANIPKQMPLATSVDLNHLAKFGLTGGNIRNVVRYAAAQAALKARKAVEQEDFLWAIKRELQKHDQVLDREQVGEEYWRKVAPEWELTMARGKQRGNKGKPSGRPSNLQS